MSKIPVRKEILLKTASGPVDGEEPFHTRASKCNDGHWLLPVKSHTGMQFPLPLELSQDLAGFPLPASKGQCFQMPDLAASGVWSGALRCSLFDKISACNFVA